MNKILIVDDSTDLLEVFPWILQRKGYNTATTFSRNGLFNHLSNFTPSLIIMDVQLNGENGRDICKELKSNDAMKHIPVILCSGNPDSLRNYAECGADDVLEKPFATLNLINKIEKLLDNNPDVVI